MKLHDYLNSLDDKVKSVLISISSSISFDYFTSDDYMVYANGSTTCSLLGDKIGYDFVLPIIEIEELYYFGKATLKDNIFVEYQGEI